MQTLILLARPKRAELNPLVPHPIEIILVARRLRPALLRRQEVRRARASRRRSPSGPRPSRVGSARPRPSRPRPTPSSPSSRSSSPTPGTRPRASVRRRASRVPRSSPRCGSRPRPSPPASSSTARPRSRPSASRRSPRCVPRSAPSRPASPVASWARASTTRLARAASSSGSSPTSRRRTAPPRGRVRLMHARSVRRRLRRAAEASWRRASPRRRCARGWVEDLFGVADLVRSEPGLRRVATDASVPAQAKAELVRGMLDGQGRDRGPRRGGHGRRPSLDGRARPAPTPWSSWAWSRPSAPPASDVGAASRTSSSRSAGSSGATPSCATRSPTRPASSTTSAALLRGLLDDKAPAGDHRPRRAVARRHPPHGRGGARGVPEGRRRGPRRRASPTVRVAQPLARRRARAAGRTALAAQYGRDGAPQRRRRPRASSAASVSRSVTTSSTAPSPAASTRPAQARRLTP